MNQTQSTATDASPSTDAERDAEKYDYVTVAPNGERACAYCRQLFPERGHFAIRGHLSGCPEYDGQRRRSSSRDTETSDFEFDRAGSELDAAAVGADGGSGDESADETDETDDHGRIRRAEQQLGEWTDDIAAIGVLATFYGMWIWMNVAGMEHAIVDQVAVGGAIAALGYVFGKRAVRGMLSTYSKRRR